MTHFSSAAIPFGSFRVGGDRKLPHSLFAYYLMAYHHEWSQSYIKGLTFEEHHVNNEWFNNMLAMLKDDGELYVPMLDKSFNKSGEEVSS